MALDFSSNLGAIQALMSPAFDAMANSRLSGKGQAMTLSEAQAKINSNPQAYLPQQPREQHSGYDFNTSMMMEGGERAFPQADYSRYQQLMQRGGGNINRNFTQQEIANSKIPEFLKESYLEEPPLSIGDATDIALNKALGVHQQNNSQQILEQKFAQANKQRVITEDSDDMYSMVDAIVAEKLNTMYKNLRKDLISIAEQIVDNISEAGMIKLGETMKVVDKEGNIYEGKMNYKGNINDVKKKGNK